MAIAIAEEIGAVLEGFEAVEAADIAVLGEGAEVEAMPQVEEMVAAPAIENTPSIIGRIQDFLTNNTYGQMIAQFGKFVGTTAASGAIMVGVMYGLNKLLAEKAKETGKRTPLSDYLKQAEKNYQSQNLTWNDEIRQYAAKAALSFPWIDCTQ
eukprot:Em0002g344a